MKNIFKKSGLIILAMSAFAFLQSCDEQGPLEETGEELDNLASEAADTTEDAARDAGNRVEDACEDLTNSNC